MVSLSVENWRDAIDAAAKLANSAISANPWTSDVDESAMISRSGRNDCNIVSCSAERAFAPNSRMLTKRLSMIDVIDTIIALSGLTRETSSIGRAVFIWARGNAIRSIWRIRRDKSSTFRWVLCVVVTSSFGTRQWFIALSMTTAMITKTAVLSSRVSKVSGRHSSQINGKLTMVTIGNILSWNIDGTPLLLSNALGQK